MSNRQMRLAVHSAKFGKRLTGDLWGNEQWFHAFLHGAWESSQIPVPNMCTMSISIHAFSTSVSVVETQYHVDQRYNSGAFTEPSFSVS